MESHKTNVIDLLATIHENVNNGIFCYRKDHAKMEKGNQQDPRSPVEGKGGSRPNSIGSTEGKDSSPKPSTSSMGGAREKRRKRLCD